MPSPAYHIDQKPQPPTDVSGQNDYIAKASILNYTSTIIIALYENPLQPFAARRILYLFRAV